MDYPDFNQEDEDVIEPLFTLDDEKITPPKNPTGNYPSLKGVVALATGESVPDGNIDFNDVTDKAWRKTIPENNAMDAMVAENAARTSNSTLYQSAITSIQQRLSVQERQNKELYDKVFDEESYKVRELTNLAAENLIVTNPAVAINNSPEKIAEVQQKVVGKTEAEIYLERQYEDATKLDYVAGFLTDVSPLGIGQGLELDKIAIEMGVDPKYVQKTKGQSYTLDLLSIVYSETPDNEKVTWLTTLNDKMINAYGITKSGALWRLAEVVAMDQSQYDGIFDALDKVGVAGGVLSAYVAAIRTARGVKIGFKAADQAKKLAELGRKDLVDTGEGVKLLNQVAKKQKLGAAGAAVGELTGLNVAYDLTKLVGLNALRVLPDSVVGASATLQKLLKSDVNKVIDDLQEAIMVRGVDTEEIAGQIKAIKEQYSPATNSRIHHLDDFALSANGTRIQTKVFHKPENVSNYVTEKAAQAFIDSQPPAVRATMRVVPDTSNNKFLVEETVTKNLLKRQQDLNAKILVETERLAKRATEKLPASDPAPKFLRPAKPTISKVLGDETVRVGITFGSKLDKAVFVLNDPSVSLKINEIRELKEWVRKVTDWSEDELATHTEKVLDAVNKKYDGVTYDTKSVRVGKVAMTKPQPAKTYPDGLLTPDERYTHDEIVEHIGVRSSGNLHVGHGVDADVDAFITKLNSMLGMDGRNIYIITDLDIEKGIKNLNLSGKFSDDNTVARLYESYKNHSSSGGLHWRYDTHTSVILMNTKSEMNNTRAKYFEVLAHEYGHAFEAQFHSKYFPEIANAFQSFLKRKGVNYKLKGSKYVFKDDIDYKVYGDYRSYGPIETMVGRRVEVSSVTGQPRIIPFPKDNKHIADWFSKPSEFFAENFAKWVFSSKLPRTTLEKYFAEIVNGVRQIAIAVNDYLVKLGLKKVDTNPDRNIAKFMNEHVRAQQKAIKDLQATVLEETKVPKAPKTKSLKELHEELADVDAELEAIRLSKEGLHSGYLVEQKLDDAFLYASVKGFDDEDIANSSRWTMGEWSRAIPAQLYAQRVTGLNQQSKYLQKLTDFIRAPLERLSGSERTQLDDALVLGDKEGKVFTDAELAGMDMSERAREAYHKVRQLRDIMHSMRNETAAKDLTRKGFKHLRTGIKFDDGSDEFFFGKQLDKPAIGKTVYVADKQAPVVVTEAFLKEAKNKGFIFYTSNEPKVINGKKHKVFAFTVEGVQVDNITNVIPYRVGEYRRIYSDKYFIKINSRTKVDGVFEDYVITHRTAENMNAAKAYVNALTEAHALHIKGELTPIKADELTQAFGWSGADLIKAFDDGEFGDDLIKFNIVYDRTEDDYIRSMTGLGNEVVHSRGDRVLSVHGEDAVNTLSPIDSVASEISNTAYVASVTEWREANINRWFNTFKDNLPASVQKMEPHEAFMHMYRNTDAYIGHDQRRAVAQRINEYMMSQLNVTSKEEKVTFGTLKLLSEKFEGAAVGVGLHANSVYKLGAAMRTLDNYPKWARTMAFHSYFAFAPVQFFMQGMNAFNAVAISPIHGTKAFKTSFLYGIALASDNENIWRQFALANKVTNLGLGMDADEFVTVMRAIKRSGLLSSMNHSSLYGANTGRYGLFNGLSRRVGAVSGATFNGGEGISRLVSFDIARREFIAANPSAAWWTDTHLQTILKRQDDLTQNMTTANRNFMQKGVLSIPFQFLQYPFNIMINVVQSIAGNKRAFTRKEALQLLVMHGIVMGTQGNFLYPFDDDIAQMVGEANLSEEQRTYISQGLLSGLLYSATDGEVKAALGTRFNTFGSIEELVRGFFDPEKKFWEVVGGASGSAIYRSGKGILDSILMLYQVEMTPANVTLALQNIGRSTFSFMNNIDKAWIAEQNLNKVFSQRGEWLYSVTDKEKWLLAMGIPTIAQVDLQVLYKNKEAQTARLDRVIKDIERLSMLALRAKSAGQMAEYQEASNAISGIINAFDSESYSQLMARAHKTQAFSKIQKMMVEEITNNIKPQDITVTK